MDRDALPAIEQELARHGAALELLAEELARVGENLDHVHDDLVALRVAARVPRDACYPERQEERP